MVKLLESIRFLEKENAALTKLVAVLRKHSGSSSRPPSSDRVKPPKDNLGKRKKSRRKIGAQNGHPKQDHIHFTDNQNDTTNEHELAQCQHCNGKLTQTDKVTKTQQVEFVDKPIFVTEHHAITKKLHRNKYCTLRKIIKS
jgi:hypothetical protein